MPGHAPSVWTKDSRLRHALQSQTVACLTGAGISAESGVPTFRGAEGLWNDFKPEELASIDAFMANPERVLEWYRFRREKISHAQPNAGHSALADWALRTRRFSVITQNVDGLHHRAGQKEVIELHGNIWHDRCMDCNTRFEAGNTEGSKPSRLPVCPCGGRVRPDVVWFGELLPDGAMETATVAAEACELFLSVGTSAVVQPAAELPYLAKRAGGFLLEINPEPTPISAYADLTLFGRAGEVLPQLLSAVRM